MTRLSSIAAWAALFALLFAAPVAAEPVPIELRGITVEERLGETVDLDAPFTDHTGARITLRGALADGKPLLLSLNYYRCATLCGFQLNALLGGLRGLDWTAGEQFNQLTVSIDPREQPELAAKKRANYLAELDRGDDPTSVDWRFLVGEETSITALAESVGFSYRYDEDSDQYAHPAALVFISPDGVITRYLLGLEYTPQDLKFALMEAGEGRVGNYVEQFVFSCFRFDRSGGKYTPFAFGMMRAGGAVTVLALGLFVAVMFTRERIPDAPPAEPPTESAT